MVTFVSYDELEQLPVLYRILLKVLLKLPNPSLPFSIVKHLPEFEGILWAIITPILLFVYIGVGVGWLLPALNLFVGFPLNVILVSATPAVIFVFFLRIQLERIILFWRNIHEPTKEWEISKRVEELAQLFEQQKKK